MGCNETLYLGVVMRDKLNLIAKHVYDYRGRYSIIGTSAFWLTVLQQPHDKWTEFEKDFRMYDKFSE